MRRPRRCTSARQNTVDRFVGAERERRMSETVDPREGGQGGEFMREVIRKRSTPGGILLVSCIWRLHLIRPFPCAPQGLLRGFLSKAVFLVTLRSGCPFFVIVQVGVPSRGARETPPADVEVHFDGLWNEKKPVSSIYGSRVLCEGGGLLPQSS